MAERGITQGEMEAVLQNPDQIVPEQDGKNAHQSRVQHGSKTFLVRVIVNDTLNPIVVVSVLRTSRVTRYWVF